VTIVSDVHGLGATSQDAGLPHNNSLGMQPPQMFPSLVAAQMKQFVEQRGPAQGNHERMSQCQGRSRGGGRIPLGMRRGSCLRAQVTATASKGDPCANFLMEFLFIDDMYSRTYPDWHQHGQKSCHLRLLDLRFQWMGYTTG
jgi:hypothetical protein